jgi:carboxypeptidase Taq
MNLDALETLHGIDASIRRLAYVSAMLQWDQETYLPHAAVVERADQLADIEGLVHERSTDPQVGFLLEQVGSTTANPAGPDALPSLERSFLKAMRRDYDRRSTLPKEFVVSLARDGGLSQAAWVEARTSNDFHAFAPHLKKMVQYAKQKSEYWGYAERPYDGLIDEYEPGMDESSIASLFGPLEVRLTKLVRRIVARARPEASFLGCEYPILGQEAFCSSLMVDLGFDTSRGRLDVSAHPFTTTLGADDVRITTRYFPMTCCRNFFPLSTKLAMPCMNSASIKPCAEHVSPTEPPWGSMNPNPGCGKM